MIVINFNFNRTHVHACGDTHSVKRYNLDSLSKVNQTLKSDVVANGLLAFGKYFSKHECSLKRTADGVGNFRANVVTTFEVTRVYREYVLGKSINSQ